MTLLISKERQVILIKALRDHRNRLISLKADAEEVNQFLTDIRKYKKDIEDKEKVENQEKEKIHPQTGEILNESKIKTET